VGGRGERDLHKFDLWESGFFFVCMSFFSLWLLSEWLILLMDLELLAWWMSIPWFWKTLGFLRWRWGGWSRGYVQGWSVRIRIILQTQIPIVTLIEDILILVEQFLNSTYCEVSGFPVLSPDPSTGGFLWWCILLWNAGNKEIEYDVTCMCCVFVGIIMLKT
jgi:hypothetical protein